MLISFGALEKSLEFGVGVEGRDEERKGEDERMEGVDVLEGRERSGVESEYFLRKMSRKRFCFIVVAIVVWLTCNV